MPVADCVAIMDVDTLYPLVTEAIRRAEALEDRDDPDAREAFSEVSQLEEHITGLIPLSDYEGAIARRGAVRAAIKAHHCGRALELIGRFEAEPGIDEDLAAELAALKAQAILAATADQEKLVGIAGLRPVKLANAPDAVVDRKKFAGLIATSNSLYYVSELGIAIMAVAFLVALRAMMPRSGIVTFLYEAVGICVINVVSHVKMFSKPAATDRARTRGWAE